MAMISDSEGTLGCPHMCEPRLQENVKKDRRRLVIAIGLCFVFMLAEIVGGYISGSLAIVTDAAHLLSDIAGFLISLFALTWSTKPANTRMSFGYHRAEILGALLSIALVWALTAYLVMEAVDRVRNPGKINAQVMLVVAVVGLIVNIVIAFTLHDSHDHNHAHHEHHEVDEEGVVGNKGPSGATSQHRSNLNIRAALIHAIGDIIQSAGVLIAAIVIWYRPAWSIADPLCTFLFSLLVFGSTIIVTRDAVHILMEGTPKDVDMLKLEAEVRQLPGVRGIHDLHIWSLAAGKSALTMHVQRYASHESDDVLLQCQSTLCNNYNIHHATIQVESRIDSRFHCHSHLPVAESDAFGNTQLPW